MRRPDDPISRFLRTGFGVRTSIALAVTAVVTVSVGLILASLLWAADRTDRLAASEQRARLVQAVRQKGLSLSRELKMQTVWGEAYRHTALSPDTGWMREFLGQYLTSLLGYDEVYVVSADGHALFGYDPRDPAASFERWRAEAGDLVAAVSRPGGALAASVSTSVVPLGDEKRIEHRAIADIRQVKGRAAFVVAETIVPDAEVDNLAPSPILVAVFHLDEAEVAQLGQISNFDGLRWTRPGRGSRYDAVELTDLTGRQVGTLYGTAGRPGQGLLGQMLLGLFSAILVLGGFGALAVRIIESKTRQVLESERRAFEAEAARTRERIERQQADMARAAYVREAVGTFTRDIDELAGGLKSALDNMMRAADTIASVSENAARDADQVIRIVSDASSNSVAVTSAASDLTSALEAVRRTALRTAEISSTAADQTHSVQAEMQALASATGEIDSVVKLIGSIADQTNLLALNATIEAARAGSAGRGFSVVANEVKLLASATAKATGEISRHIMSVQERTGAAISAMRAILEVINEMHSVSAEVDSNLGNQGAAALALMRSSERMSRSMGAVVQAMQAVEQSSKRADREAHGVVASTSRVTQSFDALEGRIDAFLVRVAGPEASPAVS